MGAANKPCNLVIITADDMSGDSAGWMGSMVGATPNIDAFAATCHQFRNCHAVVPICQPSRSALMTGRLPHRNGAIGFEPVRADVATLTEVMSRNGYFTAAINKVSHMVPPRKFGWDLTLEGSGKNPRALRAHLEQCLRAAEEKGKPFFVNANSTDPHGPFPSSERAAGDPSAAPVKLFTESEVVVPSFLEDLPPVRREIAQYFSGVRRFDESFGELIDALKMAGHLDDTIIVLVSDHGMSAPFSKATLYRNATSTPVLLRLPGMGKPVVNQDMVPNVDIMPTVLQSLGLQIPEDLDGRSWLPLLQGEKPPARDHLFTQVDSVNSGRKFPGRCVRTKTRAYIWNAWADGRTRFRIGTVSLRNRMSWKAMVEAAEQDPQLKARVDHFIYRCAEEFYDEEKDADERHNLIDHPDYQAEIKEMKAVLLAHMEKTGDPLLRQFRRAQKGTPRGFFSRWRASRGGSRT
jgi:N-sulfoglucosamine sulfohydrolase